MVPGRLTVVSAIRASTSAPGTAAAFRVIAQRCFHGPSGTTDKRWPNSAFSLLPYQFAVHDPDTFARADELPDALVDLTGPQPAGSWAPVRPAGFAHKAPRPARPAPP